VPEVVVVALAGSATALATGLGAIPVFLLGRRAEALNPFLWGLAIGLMGVAAVAGLLLPALDEGSPGAVVAGLLVGALFMLLTRRALGGHDLHVGKLRGTGVRQAVLVFVVLFVHSVPEGLAIGTAWASEREGLGLFVLLAIALQNIPEGTSVAIPMEAAGFSPAQQFWAAVGTSVPQPFAAVLAFLLVDAVRSLLPFSFAFAAGAMLALVVFELIPLAFARDPVGAASGTVIGALLMLALAWGLGV
jgi:zinc transporter, ZIP family